MRIHQRALTVLSVTLSCCGSLSFAQARPDPLQIRLIDSPLQYNDMPLTAVIGRIGVYATGDFVLFGIEVETVNGQEPKVSVSIPAGSTVRRALMEVVASLPAYSFEAVRPHLVNVFPVAARNKPGHLNNLHAAAIRLSGVREEEFLSNPIRYIPELREAVTGVKVGREGSTTTSGLRADRSPDATGAGLAPPDLELTGVTVRDNLNIVSAASIEGAEKGTDIAFGWVYSREMKSGGTGGGHSWRVHDLWDPSKRSIGR